MCTVNMYKLIGDHPKTGNTNKPDFLSGTSVLNFPHSRKFFLSDTEKRWIIFFLLWLKLLSLKHHDIVYTVLF